MKKANSCWVDADFDDDFSSDFKFAKPLPPKVVGKPSTRILTGKNNSGIWSEIHAPRSASDLAVNVKKVEEVRHWLRANLASKSPGILLITGPSGCGKTATIQALAKEMNFHVQEWANPNENVTFDCGDNFSPFGDSVPYVSQTSHFKNFMLRANRYSVLGGNGSKVILIEELPPFAFKNSPEFQNILRCYRRAFPLIFIQSESSNSRDDVISRLLFPPDVIQELGICQIGFNASAPTLLTKALQTILQIESGKIKILPMPDKTMLNSLAASTNGDIRAAINALQFTCRNGCRGTFAGLFESNSSLASVNSSSGSSSASKKRKRPATKKTEILPVIGGKDFNLDLFHAIGKVLYCKRIEEPESAALMPAHLKNLGRNQLVIDPDELLHNIPISTEGFVAFLHQSYGDFFSSIKDLSRAAEAVSLSDPFFNEWTHTGKVSLTDYGGQVTIRGICFNNVDRARKFSGIRTFHKPDWYGVVKSQRQRADLMSGYFRKSMSISNEEIASSLAPFHAEYFSESLPPGHRNGIIEACKIKGMPIKKVNVSLLPDTASENMDCDVVANSNDDELDFLIIDDDVE